MKGRNGKNTVIWVKSMDKVDDVKRKITLKDGIPAKEQRLVFNGREMLGDRSMSDYHVRKNNTLFLVLRLRGGMDTDAPPDRIPEIEDRLAEIELNYATDEYVDDRHTSVHEDMEQEVAIIYSRMDDMRQAGVELGDRVREIERDVLTDNDLRPAIHALNDVMEQDGSRSMPGSMR